ncbi:response regulator [Alkalimonas delamerensis]|uniref:Response regulator n=1 Tax=Alkalimonas delamerensis TaxID=265981 RepID=A0ABT9GNG5_9GAMM|nr:response regulator [Alkalimonas delamerensis]MDP4528513.1 response regulator [Alkalimonas delamerensis]
MDCLHTIVYFEDETEVANLVVHSLQKAGFRVHHFASFPEGGVDAIKQACVEPVDLVMLDINLPGKNGYDICRLLKDEWLSEQVPVLFTSGLMADEDILHAYEAGADDYLVKPVRLHELQLKIPKLIQQKREQFDASEQASVAMKMAFDAMKNSSELGAILRFHEVIQQASDFADLARLMFDAVREFELESSVVLLCNHEPLYFRDDESKSSLELESMTAARAKGRLYSWKRFSFFSYDRFTVLIRNMPIDDEERYGTLKDQICLLLNGVDARINSMLVALAEQAKQQKISSITKVLAKLVLEIEHENTEFSANFERIIADMETNLSAELCEFNLIEAEEQSLLNIVNQAVTAATQLFETSMANEAQRKVVMDNLLQKLVAD